MQDQYPEKWRPLLNEALALHRRSRRPAHGILDTTWETLGAGYFMPAFGHWDIVQIVLDLLPYETEFCLQQIRLVIKSLRASDGRLPGLIREISSGKASPEIAPDYGYSPPPLWPVAAAAGFNASHDRDFLNLAYTGAAKGVLWWEQNRKLDNDLFYFTDCVGNRKWESGYDDCPRWDGLEHNTRPMACVDICGQMGLYYETLAFMAESSNKPEEAGAWKKRAQQLSAKVRDVLWDGRDGLFYDCFVKDGKWRRVKSVACFWPLTAGQAAPEQAKLLAGHLSNPDEFYSAVPVPSVALNDPLFSLDCWRGPTWLSQTYWIMLGLRRYGFDELACQIGCRALDGAARVFGAYNTIFEFFHPLGGQVSELKRKNKPQGPCRDYIGHNPLLAIARSVAAIQRKEKDKTADYDYPGIFAFIS